jgi:hypothetical protein
MNENKNKYQVEDFWPDAEKLLDEHFNKNKGGSKSIYWIIALISIVTIASLAYIFIGSNDDSTNQSNKSIVIQQETQISQKQEQKKPSYSNEITSENKQIESSPSLKNSSTNELNKPVQTAASELHQSINSSTTSNTTKSGDSGKKENSRQINKLPTQPIANKSTEFNSEDASIANQLPSDKVKTTNQQNIHASIADLSDQSTDVKQIQSETQFATVTNSDSQQEKNADLTINSEPKASHIIEEPSLDINEESTAKNSRNNANKNDTSLHDLKSDKTSTAQSLKEAPAKIDTNLTTEKSSISTQIDSSKITPKTRFGIHVFAGVFSTSHHLSANNNTDFIARRNAEEASAVFSAWGLGLQLKHQRFIIKSGIEFTKYGEKINYSDWLIENSGSVQPSWNHFTDSMSTITYNYYNGIEYQRPQTTYYNDSLLSYDTTFSFTQTTNDLSNYRGTNTISYLEIPINLSYLFLQKKQLNLGVSVGGSIGFLKQSKGYYLADNMQGILDLSQTNLFRQTQFNGRLGLLAGFNFHKNNSVFIEPQYRFSLKSSLIDKAGLTQKYNSFGLSLGYLLEF